MRGKGLSGEVDDITTYLVVAYNDKTSIAAAELSTNIKVMQETVAFS